MINPNSTSESLRWVVRARWGVLLLAILLVLGVEIVTPGSERNIAAWIVLLVESCLNLLWGLAASSRRLSRIALPAGFLADALVISVWVVFSGGAASSNLVYYLIILIAASLVHSPRMVVGLGLAVILMCLAALAVGYQVPCSHLVPAHAMNPFWAMVDGAPEETRRVYFFQQALRWTIWMIIVTTICATLVRRIAKREEVLRERELMIEQQRRLLQLGELAGRLAHNLNTPLGLISGNLEMLLQKTKKNHPMRADLEQIMGFVQRAVRSMENVLNYNRRSLSQIQDVDIRTIIHDVSETAEELIQKKKGRLVLDLRENIPLLRAYPEGVYQAILNLVENAIDALPAEGGIVAVEAGFKLGTLRLSPKDLRGSVQVVVRDNGKGIPPQDLKNVFEPFYTTKGFGHGTGLGLPIARRIMEEHKGSIQVERNPDGGMKFTLVFPAEGSMPSEGEELPLDFFDR